MGKLIIERVYESARMTPVGEMVPTMVTIYRVDDMGPFTYEVDKVEFDTAKVRAHLEEEARKLQELRGT